MNYLIINGYVQSRAKWMVGNNGQNEYRFFISATSNVLDETFPVPIKCIGKLADEAYSKIGEGYYTEIMGELIRLSADKCFVLAKEIKFIPPKSKTAYYVRSTEFLELYSPKEILKRVLEKDKDKLEEDILKKQEELKEAENEKGNN